MTCACKRSINNILHILGQKSADQLSNIFTVFLCWAKYQAWILRNDLHDKSSNWVNIEVSLFAGTLIRKKWRITFNFLIALSTATETVSYDDNNQLNAKSFYRNQMALMRAWILLCTLAFCLDVQGLHSYPAPVSFKHFHTIRYTPRPTVRLKTEMIWDLKRTSYVAGCYYVSFKRWRW